MVEKIKLGYVIVTGNYKKVVLSQEEPHDATINFDKFIAASRSFHRDSTAFVLKIGKITVLSVSVYCLQILYLTHCLQLHYKHQRPFNMLKLYIQLYIVCGM